MLTKQSEMQSQVILISSLNKGALNSYVASFLMSERIAEHDKERMLADGSRGRVSVKEKLAEMKQKISDQKMLEKPKVTKSKGKEESL